MDETLIEMWKAEQEEARKEIEEAAREWAAREAAGEEPLPF
jgi:L-ribulose-5-phosphate 3-epimerase UlaE